MSEIEHRAFAQALAAEHGAIFAYGVAGAFAAPEHANQITADLAAHRAQRDATIDLLSGTDVPPPVAEAGYVLPFPVVDSVTATQLAAQIEADTTVAWRAVVEHAESPEGRRRGLDALTEAATREALWRIVIGADPTTHAFPGQP